jgi:hypothetical protein
MFLNHTQRRSTVGRTPLDELITLPEESYRLCCVVVCDLETSRIGARYIYDISHVRVNDSIFSVAGFGLLLLKVLGIIVALTHCQQKYTLKLSAYIV